MQEEASTSDKQTGQKERAQRAITISILAIVGSGILMMAAQDGRVHGGSCSTSCIANLKMLEGAKATWALENQKSEDDVPSDAELFGETKYIRVKPTCPSGGRYSFGPLSKKPRCSVVGHKL